MKTPRHTHNTHKVSHSRKNSVCRIRRTEPPAPSLYNSTARVSVTSGSLLDLRRAPPYDFHAQFCLPVAGSNFGIGWPVLASNLGANGKVELELGKTNPYAANPSCCMHIMAISMSDLPAGSIPSWCAALCTTSEKLSPSTPQCSFKSSTISASVG